MADKDSKRREAIDALIAERRKFEVWIAQLETKRGVTADHVFTRVFEDYSTRLSDVRRRLTAEADNIRGLVSDLEERLADDQRSMTDKTDERAELELRAAVGEFSPEEWADTKKSLDSAVDKIRKRFDATERDLAEMRELFDNVTSPATPAGAGATDERPELSDTVGDLEPPIAAPLEAPAAADLAVEPEPIAAVNDVVPELEPEPMPEPGLAPEPIAEPEPVMASEKAGKPVEPPPAPPVPPAAAPAAAPRPRGSTPFDDLAFLKSIAGTPTGAKGVPAVPAEPAARRAARSEPLDLPPQPLGAPTPRTSQAIRTLKCQECGTLNFPTEWYCEKCGGELAAF